MIEMIKDSRREKVLKSHRGDVVKYNKKIEQYEPKAKSEKLNLRRVLSASRMQDVS